MKRDGLVASMPGTFCSWDKKVLCIVLGAMTKTSPPWRC
jgi:hypothetical protein